MIGKKERDGQLTDRSSRRAARQGVPATKVNAALEAIFQEANQSNLALLFSLRHDFPTEWSTFVNGAGDFTTVIRKDYFPYFMQAKKITVVGFELYDGKKPTKHKPVGDTGAATTGLADNGVFTFTVKADVVPPRVLTQESTAEMFLIVRYSF